MIGDLSQSRLTVKKSVLLEAIRKNREKHLAAYLETNRAYQKALVGLLERMLDDARSGKAVTHSIKLPKPESHEEDYDRVISFLEMSVSEEITIAETQFAQYVRDQWAWKQAFDTVGMSYRVT